MSRKYFSLSLAMSRLPHWATTLLVVQSAGPNHFEYSNFTLQSWLQPWFQQNLVNKKNVYGAPRREMQFRLVESEATEQYARQCQRSETISPHNLYITCHSHAKTQPKVQRRSKAQISNPATHNDECNKRQTHSKLHVYYARSRKIPIYTRNSSTFM